MHSRPAITLTLLAAAFGSTAAAADDLRPRPVVVKPEHVVLLEHHRDDVISVKFVDGLTVRALDGALTDLGSGDLDPAAAALALVAGGRWAHAYGLPHAKLAALRDTAQRSLGRALPDLRTKLDLFLPPGVDAATAIDAFNALDVVEIALPAAVGPPAPVPPNYEIEQGGHIGAPDGMDANNIWDQLNVRGGGVRVAVIDYDWNMTHQGLPAVTLLGGAPPAGFPDQHGTASLGIVGALDDGLGTTGMAPNAQLQFAAAELFAGWDVDGAIITCLGTLGPSDVILIEQQWFGPNHPGGTTQFGLVPASWHPDVHTAILTAVGNGVTVIEPAGNGSQDLDGAVYLVDDAGTPEVENHQPFTLANDSGSIMVGAGAAPPGYGGSDVDRSRLSFSNHGATVDLQGWGEELWTTGCADIDTGATQFAACVFWADGVDDFYSANFGGTSGASAMVAGAAALLHAAYTTSTGGTLTPAALRSALIATGSPQQAGAFPTSQNIGPRPDLTAAVLSITSECLSEIDVSMSAGGFPYPPFIGGNGAIYALERYDDGNGEQLYVGGAFTSAAGVPANHVARFDGTTWSALGSGLTSAVATGFPVWDMTVHDDGGGPALYVVGEFTHAGGVAVNNVAKWDGTGWSSLGPGLAFPGYQTLSSYDDGTGAKLHVGGFDVWDGSTWSSIGSANCGPLRDTIVHDDGTGPQLYFGGCFFNVNGQTILRVARWDGTQFTQVGAGLPQNVQDLAVIDLGGGPKLYAATGNDIAVWDGVSWTTLGTFTHTTWRIAGFDDGTGPGLYVTGGFASAAGVRAAQRLAQWDGTTWWSVGSGCFGTIWDLEPFDDGATRALYLANQGWIRGTPNELGRWTGCPLNTCPADTDGSGTVDVTDLVNVVLDWGTDGTANGGDVDGSGLVDVGDLVAVILAWGACP